MSLKPKSLKDMNEKELEKKLEELENIRMIEGDSKAIRKSIARIKTILRK